MGYMFFWMLSSYDAQIAQEDWDKYLDWMGWFSLLLILLGALLILLAYGASVRRRKILSPEDLFGTFTPIYWLILAVPAGAAAAIVGAVEYGKRFGEEVGGALPASMSIGTWVFLCTITLAYLAVLVPGVTPAKFKYRPIGLFLRKKPAAG